MRKSNFALRLQPSLLDEARKVAETEGVALSPDGKTIAIGAFDTSGIISLWNIDTAEWAERACETANRSLTEGEWKQFMGDVPYEASCPEVP